VRTAHAALAVVVIAVLAGCQGTGLPSSSNTPAAPVPTTSPVDQATNEGPYPEADLLFTITTTAHAVSGATAELRAEVYSPVAFADVDQALQAKIAEECVGLRPTSEFAFTRGYFSLTDTSPAPESWTSSLHDIDTLTISFGDWSVYDGPTGGLQSACNTPTFGPGTTTGAAILLVNVAPDESGGWANTSYGFATTWETPTDNDADYPVFDDCTITPGPAAGDNPTVQKWASQKQANGAKSCVFGEQGGFSPWTQ
jgi:hypothetical protein